MPFANGVLLGYCPFISCVFMRLIGPNLMFPGISNRTHRPLFKSNIIRTVAKYIVLQSFFLRELEDSDSLNLFLHYSTTFNSVKT